MPSTRTSDDLENFSFHFPETLSCQRLLKMANSSEFILKSEHNLEISFSNKIKNSAQYVLDQVNHFITQGGGDSICITNTITGEAFSYQDVHRLSHVVAKWLKKQGFKPGDILIYSSHDGAKLHIFLLGVWLMGGVARSSYPEDHGGDLVDRILESHAKWIFCDVQYINENLKARENVLWEVEIITSIQHDGCVDLSKIFENDTIMEEDTFECHEGSITDPALILQTSGTSGGSKGVVYTHQRLLNNILVFQNLPFVKEQGVKFLLTSRLTHFTGTVIPLAFIACNNHILVNPSPSLSTIAEAIAHYQVDGILAFPKFLLGLANDVQNPAITSTLKFAVTAGQVVGPSFVNAVRTIPSLQSLFVIYGMTEVGILSVNVNWSAAKQSICRSLEDYPPFSCGKLAPGNELLVRDLSNGEPLGCGELGEFYFRSPYSAIEYFKQPEATADTFEDNWVRSGDVGYYDKNGFVYLKDRIKETFKYFNNHICPSELENLLLTHPEVSEACVIGVPDDEGGDTVPQAHVVLKNAEECMDPLLVFDKLADIKEFFDGQVASYKRLRGGIFYNKELPVGKTGKVLKSELLRKFLLTLSL